MAERTKNLCAQIPEELHLQLRQKQEKSGLTLGPLMTQIITQFLEMEEKAMTDKNTRPVAFQAPADLFDQFKVYLKRHNITQKDFFIRAIEQALAADAQAEG
jgi:hypothetical protein